MQARLAEPDAQARDLPHPESPADQLIQPHAADNRLTARLGTRQADVLQRFRLDQGQRLAGHRALGKEMPIAPQSLPGERADEVDGHDRVARPDVDCLDCHMPIIAASAARSNPILPGCERRATSSGSWRYQSWLRAGPGSRAGSARQGQLTAGPSIACAAAKRSGSTRTAR